MGETNDKSKETADVISTLKEEEKEKLNAAETTYGEKVTVNDSGNAVVEPVEHDGGRKVAWVPGIILIGLGLIFLLSNFTDFHLQNWWALFILIPAIASFSKAVDAFRSEGEPTRVGRANRMCYSDLGGFGLSVQSQLGLDLARISDYRRPGHARWRAEILTTCPCKPGRLPDGWPGSHFHSPKSSAPLALDTNTCSIYDRRMCGKRSGLTTRMTAGRANRFAPDGRGSRALAHWLPSYIRRRIPTMSPETNDFTPQA